MTVPVLTPHAAREQAAFRSLLNALARPGTVATAELHPRGGRYPAAVTLLESVLDHEVTFALVPEQADVTETLLRLTGSYVAPLDEADYLLCAGNGIARALEAAKTGTPEFPDRSATVIALAAHVSAEPGQGEALTLAGPGIRDTRTVWLAGFSAECRSRFALANRDLPMGVDLVLLAPDGRFTCLNRYTRLVGKD